MQQFEGAIERLPNDPAPAYAAALCYFALRDAVSFERTLVRLAQTQDLAPRKRHKLDAMRALCDLLRPRRDNSAQLGEACRELLVDNQTAPDQPACVPDWTPVRPRLPSRRGHRDSG